MVEKALGRDRVQHRERGRGRDRVAPERGPVVSGLEQGAGVTEGEAGADRDPARQALGQSDQVGLDALGGGREPASGAPDTRLHLVQPEQGTVVTGDPACGREVAGGRDVDPGLALQRLEHDGGRLFGDGVGQRVGVAVRDERDVTGKRLERLAVGGLRCERERAHGPPVEGLLRCDEVGATGLARGLEARPRWPRRRSW